MSITEMKLTGFGGQGIILTAILIGKATSIFENRNAVLIQSFGPEARGGACQAQVIISDDPILYPYVKTPNILMALSQEAHDTYIKDLTDGGILIYEKDMVNPGEVKKGIKSFGVPSTQIAEELGRKIVLNMVTLGFLTAVTRLAKPESMKKAIESTVPKGTIDLNLRAFDRGFKYFSNGK